MNYTEDISGKMLALLEMTYEAELGFDSAVDVVIHPRLKAYLENRAIECHNFGDDLRQEIMNNWNFPEEDTTVSGPVTRNWAHTTTYFITSDEELVFAEALREEKAFLKKCEELLASGNLPESTVALLKRQKALVIAALENTKVFEYYAA